MKIELVEWLDSRFGITGWHGRGSNKDFGVAKAISVGVIVYEDDKNIVVAPNLSERDTSQEISIPRKSIVRRRQLKMECIKEVK